MSRNNYNSKGDVGINDPTKTNGKAYIKIKYAGEDLIFELRSQNGSPSPAELQSDFMKLYSRVIKHIKSATSGEQISPRSSEAQSNHNSQNQLQHELSNGSADELGQPKKSKVLFDVQVVDSKKIEEGADPHVEYRVVSKTNLPQFNAPQCEVYHRYSEFELLRRQLTGTHRARVRASADLFAAQSAIRVSRCRVCPPSHSSVRTVVSRVSGVSRVLMRRRSVQSAIHREQVQGPE